MRLTARPLAAVALAAAVAIAGCTARPGSRESSDTTSSEAPNVAVGGASSPEPAPILGYELPTDVAALEADLGQPDSIERPDADDPSPWGQWLEWTLEDGSTFRALCDDYSPDSTDSAASVRVIELRAALEPVAGRLAETPTVLGLDLNGSDIEEVRDALPGGEPSLWHDRGELDPGDVYRDTIRYEYGGLYTYFFFGEDGLLVGVAQATLQADMAD